MSDGTDRPSWIGYDTSTGELRGFPNTTGSSQYLNLMFTAFDTKEGFYSYHKTLLVDSKPMTKSLFKILELAVDRQFAYYYSDLFYDPDGDFLYFYIQKASDLTTLRSINVNNYETLNILAGTPTQVGVYANIILVAEDPYGLQAKLSVTLIIKDYAPYRRNIKIIQGYPNQVVTVGIPFQFVLSNELFFDIAQDQPLVLFATLP